MDAEEKRTLATVQLAVKLGGDVKASTKGGDTALHAAASRRFRSVVSFLIDNGADPNVTNAQGYTALAVALSAGQRFSTSAISPNAGTMALNRTILPLRCFVA